MTLQTAATASAGAYVVFLIVCAVTALVAHAVAVLRRRRAARAEPRRVVLVILHPDRPIAPRWRRVAARQRAWRKHA